MSITPGSENNNDILKFNAELDQISSITDYSYSLNELVTIDKSDMSLEEIRTLYFDKAKWFINRQIQLLPNNFRPLVFFRVRAGIKTTEDLTRIKTFSYPDPKYCTSNGRANIKSQPVFYCSLDATTAVKESRFNTGEDYYLGVWSIDFNDVISCAPIIPFDLHENHPLKSLVIDENRVIHAFTKEGLNNGEKLELLYNILSWQFISETDPYPLTSFLSDEILFKQHIADCLYYPSYQFEQKNVNFAFRPDFVDKYFRLNKVYKYQIESFDGVNIRCGVFAYGIVENDKIIWNNINETEGKVFADFLKLKVDS